MGSGSSKTSTKNTSAGPQTKNDASKIADTPTKAKTSSDEKNGALTNSPAKHRDHMKQNGSSHNSPKRKSPSKNKKWDSDDSDFEDDLDDFINDTVTSSANAVSRDEEPIARPRTSHGRSARGENNAYPETYAQRKAREQYSVDKGMMSRQKTMIRDPNEWKNVSDEEEEDKHGGFDASKFRKINKNQEFPDSNTDTPDNGGPVLPVNHQKTPEEDYGIYQRDLKEKMKRRLSRLPSYSTEEQKLMEELLNSEY